ncbi:MAG TPA: thymidine phosphorylase [Candidatus Saccharimonadales bacterium]|nr:thymidine phosphorylase [Candidatus Saccharimonadales bacterium]
MNALPLIEAKREGRVLSQNEISGLITAYTAGNIPDYQMAALLMAIYFQGLTPRETRDLTLAMRDSGEVLHFPKDGGPLVDKHSTGGVGDKVSLVLAPLLASLGFRVPMISGRGLGITGGTLDKLESIPGFKTDLSAEQIVSQVQSIGVAMVGQTEKMVPADKALYALRDVTGTVPSIPLITASILSKKLTEGLSALVMDVKFGAAAFMTDLEQGRQLAQSIVALAAECGLKSRALLTRMDEPLGRACGNWLEVREAVECLENRGPSDLRELVLACAASLLVQTGLESSEANATAKAEKCLTSGAPLQKWEQLVAAQGGKSTEYRTLTQKESAAPVVLDLIAESGGYVTAVNARIAGEVVRDLGGGRLAKDSRILPGVGLDRMMKRGEPVERGALLCRVHAQTKDDARQALPRLRTAFAVSTEKPVIEPLIADRCSVA